MSDAEEFDGEEEADGLVLDEDESSELQGIFATIFPQYLVPIEELIQQILDGQVSAEIVDGLRAAIGPLISAAKSIGVIKIEEVLQEFKSTIDGIDTEAAIDDDARDGLIDVFYRLKELVHTLSDPDVPGESDSDETGASARRPRPETIRGGRGDFVKRLGAVDGVAAADVQRILAAGVSSAEQVLGATADEIAAVAGIDESLAERIQLAFGGRRRRGKKRRRRTPSARKVVSRRAKIIKPPPPPPPTISVGEFESGIALFSLVRERIRLSERLAQEEAPTQRLHAELDELTRQATQLRSQLRRSEEELAHENETVRQYEGDVESLVAEVKAAKNASLQATETEDGVDLALLKDRLDDLRHRIEQRLRLG